MRERCDGRACRQPYPAGGAACRGSPAPAWPRTLASMTMPSPDAAAMHAVLAGEADPGIAEIVTREAELRAAQLAADVAALDGLIAEELLFTGPDGRLGTKAQDLEAHGSGAVRFRRHEPEELRVRRVGANVAVSALRARLAVEVGEMVHEGTFRYTRVWAREPDGTWRVVGGHVSEVPAGS